MKDDDQGGGDRLLEHSLPGTNQAGKGPSEGDTGHSVSREAPAPEQRQRREHSLPGTNQAGKGPSEGDTGDRG